MKIKIGMVLSAVSLMASAQSNAADLPKQGEAEYDTYYVFENLAKIETGVGIGGIDDFTGITRNVKGEGPFHDMSVRCLTHWSMIAGKFNGDGTCVETDKEGDQIFTTFDDDAHYLIGGTGKYKGITGMAPFTVDNLHDATGGRVAIIVNHKVSWEIK